MQVPSSTGSERLRPITLAEWAELPEEEAGEFVDGYLVEEEEMGAIHDVVLMWLGAILSAYVDAHGGFVGSSDTTRFAVSTRRGRKPDLWVYLGSRKPPAEGLVSLPPDVIAEVVSNRPHDQRRDRVEKLDEYAAFGVRWYWIVDPQLRSFEVFELGPDGRYVHALGASSGRLETIPGCPGLGVDLDALWARLDALAAP